MSHPKFTESAAFHARSAQELETGKRTVGAQRTLDGRHYSSLFCNGAVPPAYTDMDGGYGVKQSRFNQRPGGYGWKAADKKMLDTIVGDPSTRFGGYRQPQSLIVSPATLTPPKDVLDCFVALPGNTLNARNTMQPPFTTHRSVRGISDPANSPPSAEWRGRGTYSLHD
mmetsp:Transcript_26609/g.47351  ORF Transcript_26609/g.47351 Transcript_26609/m.47351 type:complete len:169 (-) Transcript_26609:179-685(-)